MLYVSGKQTPLVTPFEAHSLKSFQVPLIDYHYHITRLTTNKNKYGNFIYKP